MFIVVIARFWNLPLRELPLENVPEQLTARVAGIAGTSVDAPPPGVVRGMRHETKPMEPAPHPRRRRWWLIAIAVLVLLGVATKFYTAYGHAEPVPFYRISPKSTLQVTDEIDKRFVFSRAIFFWRGRLRGEERSLGWKLRQAA